MAREVTYVMKVKTVYLDRDGEKTAEWEKEFYHNEISAADISLVLTDLAAGGIVGSQVVSQSYEFEKVGEDEDGESDD